MSREKKTRTTTIRDTRDPAPIVLVDGYTRDRRALDVSRETPAVGSLAWYDANDLDAPIVEPRRRVDVVAFDYDRQAWTREGRYVRCGHPETMDCGCYGREHEGEERS